MNQAALRAAIDQVDQVSLKHLESARDKILMGKLLDDFYKDLNIISI